MKNWSKSIPALCILLTGLLFTQRVNAQCSIKIVGPASGCAPFQATFERTDNSGKKIASVTYSYSGGGTASDTNAFYQISFPSPGSYKLSIKVTYTDGSTPCISQLPQTIVVFAPPIAKINLPTDPVLGPIQCFKRNGQLNSFTFTESSISGSSGAPVVKWFWNFGDGDTSTQHNPKHSYQASGSYNISLRVIDTNGCEGYDTIVGHIVVLKDIQTGFKQNGTVACNKDSIQFLNTTDTANLHMKAYYWNFADGSPVDSTNYNPSHIFTPGKYLVSLTIENSLGCTATDTQTVTVAKFEIKIFFQDTMCWSFAHNSGVVFNAEPQPTAIFWSWNFGDPNSGPQDIVNFAWSHSHKFAGGPSAGGNPGGAGVGGPGIYDVAFSVTSPTCGTLDTCFYVHILGPMALVNLPAPNFPQNDTVPPLRVPKSAFLAIDADHSTCDANFIKYITFRKITALPTAHWTYHFCNADTAVIKGKKALNTSEMADCKGNRVIPYVYGVTLKPTDSTVSYYRDSVGDTTIWSKGNAIPTKPVYYPGSPGLAWNNMHDSNQITCTLPNLVRFTNNSIKWRLHYAIDDNTFQNVLAPSQSFRDTCKWKNYPMSSDSLIYYWTFNDPSGVKCTETAKNKDSIPGVWNCNFSTLAAPYHYYRGINGLPPSGCQTVQMSVYDPVTGCKDSLNPPMMLVQGPPQAGWNKLAYCKMTWEMQETQLAPAGSPGPAGPPLIGFRLMNQPNACAGYEYPFRIDFGQTIPSCGAQNWWVVFDSANVVKYKHCPGGDSVLDYGFTGDLGPGYSPAINGYPSGAPASFWLGLPWLGNYWYNVGDSGCKTIGIVLQVGQCFDTAWYHDYICFNKLDAVFNIFSIVPPNSGTASQADPSYGIGSGGGTTIPGDSGVGYTQVFVDSSESGHGHICQSSGPYSYGTSTLDIQEGVRLYLFPRDTNQTDVTTFQYNITRNTYATDPLYTKLNGVLGPWYYTNPPTGLFWPDSAVLNPFSTVNDSVAQVKEHVNYIDTPNIYIIIPPSAATVGLPPKRILFQFPIYGTDTTGELDSLIARNHVNINVNDERARRIDAVCGKPYITVYTDPGFKVVGHTQILRLGGFKAVDSFITTPVGPGTGPEMTLPYPGFYTISAISTNLEGCTQSSTYLLIYGHYAEFWVSDSVICLGQPVTLHWYVRYWSTNCPPPPGGGPPPPGCLNGNDPQEFLPGLTAFIDFNPWDSANPTAYRDSITGGLWKTNTPPGYRPETIAFNMGVPGDTVFHPITPLHGPISQPYIYQQPGVYTVMMKTTDWRGCSVYTVRKNLMKVIQTKAKFSLLNPADTLSYCPPKTITYVDSSTIAGNKYTQKVVKNGQIVDSTFVVDSITDRLWKPGDGQSIVKTSASPLFQYDYLKADSLNVSLTVLTSFNCFDSMYRPHYVTVIGPTPRFELVGNTAGCAPFVANVHVTSHDKDIKSWTWNFGDYPKNLVFGAKEDTDRQTATAYPGVDTLFQLPYSADTGTFRVTLTEVDTFKDISGGYLPCPQTWPLPTDKDQYYVTVYPHSPITINGDSLLCVNNVGKYLVTSKYNEYKTFAWTSNPLAHIAVDSTKNGVAQNQILFTLADWQAGYTAGDTDSQGNVLFTITVKANSDTGGAQTGCKRDTTFKVKVQDSKAGFWIDSTQRNSATFTFHDVSQYVKKYELDYGDGDSINSLQPHFIVTHTYTNLGGNNVPEGVPQPIVKFQVKLTTWSSNGCENDSILDITILREFDHYNVFTPNSNDTINSRFAPFIKGQISSSLKIYNRWGQLVFQSKGSNADTAWSRDPANTWDGNDQGNGQPCPVGTYYYIWSFELVGGESKTINGAVTLIR